MHVWNKLSVLFFNLNKNMFHWFKRERERGISMRERKINWLPPICVLTRDWTYNPGMCCGPESNHNFWCTVQCFHQLSYLTRAAQCKFCIILSFSEDHGSTNKYCKSLATLQKNITTEVLLNIQQFLIHWKLAQKIKLNLISSGTKWE